MRAATTSRALSNVAYMMPAKHLHPFLEIKLSQLCYKCSVCLWIQSHVHHVFGVNGYQRKPVFFVHCKNRLQFLEQEQSEIMKETREMHLST